MPGLSRSNGVYLKLSIRGRGGAPGRRASWCQFRGYLDTDRCCKLPTIDLRDLEKIRLWPEYCLEFVALYFEIGGVRGRRIQSAKLNS